MKPRNHDCKSANGNCQAAIPIAAWQTPNVGLQSLLQPCKRQMSGCNPDCSVAKANCQAAIPIAARQTPIVRLQLQPVIDVRNPHVVPLNSWTTHCNRNCSPSNIFRLIMISSTVQKSPLRSGCLKWLKYPGMSFAMSLGQGFIVSLRNR